MNNFWKKLNKPFFVLAPMADVTDAAFRRMFVKYGKPDVLYTEFVSADGLFLGGGNILEKDLMYTEEESPIVAQFFSKDPKLMKRAGALAVERGFDGVDINMGCPAKVICAQGAGAAMINDPEGAKKIIRATKEGTKGKIPVSVKTRIGYNKNETETWIPVLLGEDIDALVLHARTKKDMSKALADWSNIKRAVEIRNEMGKSTLIVGNGDVGSIKEAQERVKETGCDGVMIGRGAFGNPWFFASLACTKCNRKTERPSQTLPSEEKKNSVLSQTQETLTSQSMNSAEQSECDVNDKFCKVCDGITPNKEEKLEALIEHTKLFEKLLGDTKPFPVMKKHFKAYVSGWSGAKELRMKLMKAESADDVEEIIRDYLDY